jgi:hypothetical protein
MTMLGWFLMAAFALIASLALWWAGELQRRLDRANRKIDVLVWEREEEIEYAHRAFRDFSPEDPATVLLFPENEGRRA